MSTSSSYAKYTGLVAGGGGGGVTSLNGETGALTITGTGGIVISTPTGTSINVDGSGVGGSITIGEPVVGGTANRILFEDGSADLGDSASLTWDGSVLTANTLVLNNADPGTTSLTLQANTVLSWTDGGQAYTDGASNMYWYAPGSLNFGSGGNAVDFNSNVTVSGNVNGGSWEIQNNGQISFDAGNISSDGSGDLTAQQYALPTGGNLADNGGGGIEANVSDFYVNGNLVVDNSGTTSLDSGDFITDGSGNVTASSFTATTGGFVGDGSQLTSVPAAIGTIIGASTINTVLFVDNSNELAGNNLLTTDGAGTIGSTTWSITGSDGHMQFDGGLVSSSGTGALTASSFNGGLFNGDGSGLGNIPLSGINVTVSGNTTELASVTGIVNNAGHAAAWDASGNLIDGGLLFTSPMTTLGDIIYENATPAAARLAGNTTTTKKYLAQTGTGSVSAAPVWSQPAFSELTGTATIAQGGTNNGSLAVTAGGVPYTDGSKLVNVGAGTSGNYLQSNGSSAPTWATPLASLNNYFNGYLTATTGNATWSTSSTSYANGTITSGSSTLTTRVSNGITVTAAAGNAPGITWTPSSSSAVYLVSCTFLTSGDVTGSGYRLYDGTNVVGLAILNSNVSSPITITGVYVPGTASAITLDLQAVVNTTSVSYGQGSSFFGFGSGIEWQIVQIK